MWHLLKKLERTPQENNKLVEAFRTMLGLTPSNPVLYRLAVTHASKAETISGFKQSNERLEFLGDAVFGAIATDYIFKKYPQKDEGFLTEVRSRIVNRESLNKLGRKIGIADILEYDTEKISFIQSKIFGDTLEAIVGAIYLDKGYSQCKKIVIDKLIQPYFDLQEITNTTLNYKSKIIEWAQEKNVTIHFKVEEMEGEKLNKGFVAEVFLDDRPCGKGFGQTKKKATQDASKKAYLTLDTE